jgi:hypothetical protein
MKAALLMDREKWDWQTYERQPQWLVAMLFSFLQNEAEAMERKKA